MVSTRDNTERVNHGGLPALAHSLGPPRTLSSPRAVPPSARVTPWRPAPCPGHTLPPALPTSATPMEWGTEWGRRF